MTTYRRLVTMVAPDLIAEAVRERTLVGYNPLGLGENREAPLDLAPGLTRADHALELDRRAREAMARDATLSYRAALFAELARDPWLKRKVAELEER